jgi:hypothetical protein
METDAAAAAAGSSSSALPLLEEELTHLRRQLEDEQHKMDRWKVENLRRKHNYVPFIFNLLRMLAEKGKLQGLVESAVKSSAERAARSRQQAAGAKRKDAPNPTPAGSGTTAATTQPTPANPAPKKE